jgi:hypothetical protein
MHNKLYLDIIPDFIESGIMIKESQYLTIGDSLIPDALFMLIIKFNEKVREFWVIGEISKYRYADLVFMSDRVGFKIKLEIEKQTGAEVRYFSAGLNKFLTSEPQLNDYILKLGPIDRILRNITLFLRPEIRHAEWNKLMQELETYSAKN